MFAQDVRKTIMGNYSSLAMLDMGYGGNSAAKWLDLLINDVNKFAGSKSMDEKQAESLAYLLAQEYKDVKFSVIQLFFYKFKCGYFGKFYGQVDPMVIACALKDFVQECEAKRQAYLCEAFEVSRQDADERRAVIRNRWDACMSELYDLCPDEEGKKMFVGVGVVDFDDAENILTLDVLDSTVYGQIEGKYLGLFSKVVSKHYPKARVQYRLRHRQPVGNTVDPKELERRKLEKERQVVVENARRLLSGEVSDPTLLDNFKYGFRRRYGLTPEEYIAKYGKDTQIQQVERPATTDTPASDPVFSPF